MILNQGLIFQLMIMMSRPEEDKKNVQDFEPSPNVSVYDNGIGLKNEKVNVDDFEPRPNVSVYHE